MERFDSRTILYATVNTMSEDFFEFLNKVGSLKKSVVQWNMIERNISIAEHRSESNDIERMMELLPRLMDASSTYFSPMALVRGDYVLQDKEACNESAKNALDSLAKEEAEEAVTTSEEPSEVEAEEAVTTSEDNSEVEAEVVTTTEETSNEEVEEVVTTTEETSDEEVAEVATTTEETSNEEVEEVTTTTEETSNEEVEEVVTTSEETSEVEAEEVVPTTEEISEVEAEEVITTSEVTSKVEEVVPSAEATEKSSEIKQAQEELTEAQKAIRAEERVRILREKFMEGFELPDKSNEKVYTLEMYRRCVDLAIKSKVFSTCLIFANVENSEKAVYDATSRALGMNSGLVMMDARKSYKRWVKTMMPDFVSEYPETTICDLFNVFREERKMF